MEGFCPPIIKENFGVKFTLCICRACEKSCREQISEETWLTKAERAIEEVKTAQR